MRNILLTLVVLSIVGCATQQRYAGIVHDYMFVNGQKQCSSHGGLHYVTNDMVVTLDEKDAFPCREIVKFRCQDSTLIQFDTGLGYCFIPKSQMEDNGIKF